jgi:hypothetical protein
MDYMSRGHAFIDVAKEIARWGAEQQLKVDAEEIDQAYTAGADSELEACCEWFQEFYKTESWVTHDLKHLRAARRPKPPTLKEQALDELASAERLYPADWSTIRKALEALPND